jgi:hypothetical protein
MSSGNNAQIIAGKGVAGVFDSFLFILDRFAVTLIVGAAVLWFMYLAIKYVWLMRNGKGTDEIKKDLPFAIVILTVMFSVYALIKLFASMFSIGIGQ